jgi:hypothetical protein
MSSAQTKPAFRVFNGLAPEEMPKGMPWVYDFSSVGDQSFDLQLENTGGIIQMVQSIFVDNSDNAAPVTIQFTITNQRLVIPANAQGIWPVIAPLQTQIRAITTPSAALKVTIILLNVPMPYTQWGPSTTNIAPGSLNATAVASAAPPVYAAGAQPLSQDLSGNLRTTLTTALPAGGNTIGGVNVIAALPAGTNQIGTVIERPRPALTATKSNVAWNAAAQALLAANNNRIGGSVVNDTDGIMFILLGAGAASATNFSYVIDAKTTVAGQWEIPGDWNGLVSCFWSTGSTGAARVTERTA